MKCPQCLANQKYKDGMTCRGCGYRFALDPKKPPYITDSAFKSALLKLSHQGRYWFTRDQLYVRIHRLIQQKKRIGPVPLVIGGIFFAFWGSGMLMGIGLGMWPAILWILLLAAGIAGYRFRHVSVPPAIPERLIQAYQSLHPIEHLADGRRLGKAIPQDLDEDLFAHGPEGILITDRSDTAEMLILNRFHFENRILVVSQEKYPPSAFEACRGFLSRHPDIPVYLIHDCSREGLRMQGKLVTDPEWGLDEKRIRNLGFHPGNVDRLKSPVWIPEALRDKEPKRIPKGSTADHLQNGYRLPLGIAPPGAFAGTLALAVTAGLSLMSEELLAMQQESAASGSGGISFGFG